MKVSEVFCFTKSVSNGNGTCILFSRKSVNPMIITKTEVKQNFFECGIEKNDEIISEQRNSLFKCFSSLEYDSNQSVCNIMVRNTMMHKANNQNAIQI